jgi:small-conductance mechanosensitive channel
METTGLIDRMKEFLSQVEFFDYKFFTLANIIGAIFKVLIIFVLVKVLIRIGTRFINSVFTPSEGSKKLKIKQRQAITLKTLLQSILRYVLYFVGAIMVLQVFGVKTDSLLASAGILGLAVSFGAQSLVADVITGFFLIFEDQFSVGEYVNVAGVWGIVEETGLRVTRIRGFDGELYIVPNGLIKQVTNYNRGNLRALVEIGIAHDEDIERAIGVINPVLEELAAEMEEIVEGPTVYGVTDLGQSEVVVRVVAKTEPMAKWKVESELRKRIKAAFTREGIAAPYPRRVIVNPEPREKGE